MILTMSISLSTSHGVSVHTVLHMHPHAFVHCLLVCPVTKKNASPPNFSPAWSKYFEVWLHGSYLASAPPSKKRLMWKLRQHADRNKYCCASYIATCMVSALGQVLGQVKSMFCLCVGSWDVRSCHGVTWLRKRGRHWKSLGELRTKWFYQQTRGMWPWWWGDETTTGRWRRCWQQGPTGSWGETLQPPRRTGWVVNLRG